MAMLHRPLLCAARDVVDALCAGQGASMGATILDALDTLLVMGMIDEYKKARQWIKDSLRHVACPHASNDAWDGCRRVAFVAQV